MFSKYAGCDKHKNQDSSNFDPHCPDCWDAVEDAQIAENDEDDSVKINRLAEQISKWEKQLYTLVMKKNNYMNNCECNTIRSYDFSSQEEDNGDTHKFCLNCGGMVPIEPE